MKKGDYRLMEILMIIAMTMNFYIRNWLGVVVDAVLLLFWRLGERKKTAPLTSDELERMGGKHVWIVGEGPNGWCALVKEPGEDMADDGYGVTWIAFRDPPEERRAAEK